MSALGALVYADWRATLNDARRVGRSPGRIVLWLMYLGILGFFFSSRMRAGRGGATPPDSALTGADVIVCTLLASLVFALATGRGAIGIFRSRVEARFIIGSPLPAPLAIAYLQLRETLAQSVRFVFSLCYLVFVFVPRELGFGATLADLALVLAVYMAAAAIVVPRRLLPPRAGVACLALGVPLGVLVVLPAVRDLVARIPLPAPVRAAVLAGVPAWHPGRVLLEPHPIWLVAALALMVAAIGVLAAAGRDAYPELYGLSIARIEGRERVRARRTVAAAGTAAHRPAAETSAPAGVAALVWKSVVEFRRAVRVQTAAAGALLWCLAGFVAARAVAAGGDALFWALAAVGVNLVLVFALAGASTLAAELGRPLFWLSPAGLFERLCALAVAQVWRPIGTIAVFAAGFAVGGAGFEHTLVFALGFPAVVTLLAGIAFLAAVLFPSAADQRGPIAVLRLGIAAVLLVPPLVVYGIGAAGLNAPTGALLAGSLLALIEAGTLIGIAAWRVDGRIDRMPVPR